ncbi:MAG: hypothetical protein IRY99_24745, partial [Isosphaeraceae bacterium]|nr:hypothetical protein [Isosphaeraceae bacterium]
MNFLILGDGAEELAWARALADHPEHRLTAACPGFKAFPDLPGGPDLDAALAAPDVNAAIIGGPPDLRAEGLRRAAGAGLPILCLHPPGENADPYYQVALSRQETGAVVVPDLPLRLHPGVVVLEKALREGPPEAAAARSLRLELPVGPGGEDLLGQVFPQVVDVIRALVGEIEAVTATGDPPGPRPTTSLIVQMRGPGGRRAEVRLTAGPPEPARLVVVGPEGSTTLEFDPALLGPSRLIQRTLRDETVTDLDPWDPKSALLRTLEATVAGQPAH